jgi:hypothetical protein
MKKRMQKFPPGWDEAAFAASSHTAMKVPVEWLRVSRARRRRRSKPREDGHAPKGMA